MLILPVLRHLRSGRDSVIAGLLSGPPAMAPAIVLLVALVAFYPAIINEPLRSARGLSPMDVPIFHVAVQAMAFFALLECSLGFVHAFIARLDTFNAERVGATTQRERVAVTATLTLGSIFMGTSIGLVALIANGYRAMAVATLFVFVVPLCTIGTWRS